MSVCLYVCPDVTKINFVNFLKIGSYDFFWTPVREGPIRSLLYVCLSVCMYVWMDVTKINLVNLLKIGSYDFF